MLQVRLFAAMSIFHSWQPLNEFPDIHDLVDLGGIEPPSASDSPFVIRPFPIRGFAVTTLSGQSGSHRPTPPVLSPESAVFLAVSGLSLLSTTTSVARL